MLEFVAFLSALIWVPILFYHLTQRAFIVLLIWFVIAPVMTNVINGRLNPLFPTEENFEHVRIATKVGKGKITNTNVKIKELLAPTRILVVACFIALVLNTVVKRNRMIPFDGTELWMCVFSLIIVTNTLLLSEHVAFSLRTALDAFIVPFLGYYVTRRLVTSEEHFRQLVKFLGYLGILIFICCLAERLAYSAILHRLRGPFAGVSEFYVVLITVFYAMLEGTQTRPPILRRVLLYLIPIITVLTWQRTNWVSFLAGIWVFLFFGRRLINSSKKLGMIGVALIVIPVMMIAIQVLMSTTVVESRIVNTETVDFRFKRWIVALQEGVKHPIFGIGLNNARELFGQVIGDYFQSHNSFVSFFTELGTIGLLAYLAVVGSIVRLGLRLYQRGAYLRDQWRGIVLMAVMVAYQVSGIFYQTLHIVNLCNIYIFIFIGGVSGLYGQPYARGIGNRRSEYVSVPFTLPRSTRV